MGGALERPLLRIAATGFVAVINEHSLWVAVMAIHSVAGV